MDVGLSELREFVMDREAWRAAICGVAKSWTRLSNWSDLIWSDAVQKMLSNIEEVKARGAFVLAVTCEENKSLEKKLKKVLKTYWQTPQTVI